MGVRLARGMSATKSCVSRSGGAMGVRLARGMSATKSCVSRSGGAMGVRLARGMSAVGSDVKVMTGHHYACGGREEFHKRAIREEIRA